MLLYTLNARVALAARALGLGLIAWTVLASRPAPGLAGHGLVITVLLVLGALAWAAWSWRAHAGRTGSADLFAMVAAGGLLIGATPSAAGSAFSFVAIVTAGFRLDPPRSIAVTAFAVFTLALGVVLYDQAAVAMLAYGLGFLASFQAGSSSRQAVRRAEQAELLLVQAQRSREEQLRAARLEESARIAREIHDVLAHTLAGLTIQLEATRSLLDGGAPRAIVSERLSAAHALAREGLVETRRAVGVLRGEGLDVSAALDALLAGHREVQPAAAASLAIAGDPARLEGPVALAVVRVAQEALTNVRKHAPGAAVRVELDVGVAESGALDLRVRDGGHTRDGASVVVGSLAGSGGGYGLRGMRERAQILGGSLQAGPDDDGWRVELRLPLTATAHDLPDAAGGER